MKNHVTPMLLVVCMLGWLGACQQARPLVSLTFSGIDACVDRVSVNVTQGTQKENLTAQVQVVGGVASLTLNGLGSIIDMTLPLQVTIRVLSVRPNCDTLLTVGHEYRFDGTLPAAQAGVITLLAANTTRTNPTRVNGGFGDVRGGQAPFVVPRGVGSTTIVLWAQPRAGNACTSICWEQWVNQRLFLTLPGGAPQEVRNGQPTPTNHVFGTFGRDLPNGSVGNCFRLDPIPNVPGQTGIVDAPGFDALDAQAVRGIYAAGRADAGGAANFTLQFQFNVRSVLVCDTPLPRRTLGFYSWQVTQTFVFENPPAGRLKATISYRVDNSPAWTNGNTGLRANGIQAP